MFNFFGRPDSSLTPIVESRHFGAGKTDFCDFSRTLQSGPAGRKDGQVGAERQENYRERLAGFWWRKEGWGTRRGGISRAKKSCCVAEEKCYGTGKRRGYRRGRGRPGGRRKEGGRPDVRVGLKQVLGAQMLSDTNKRYYC